MKKNLELRKMTDLKKIFACEALIQHLLVLGPTFKLPKDGIFLRPTKFRWFP